MALRETLEETIKQVDNLLIQTGLYAPFTYTQVTEGEEGYDEVTGDYTSAATTSTTYTFNAVPLGQRGAALNEGSYGVMMDIIAIPFNLPFELSVDLPFVYNGTTWTVDSFKTAPQNGVYEIVLGRK